MIRKRSENTRDAVEWKGECGVFAKRPNMGKGILWRSGGVDYVFSVPQGIALLRLERDRRWVDFECVFSVM